MNIAPLAAQLCPSTPMPSDPFSDTLAKLTFLLSLPPAVPTLQLGRPFVHYSGAVAETGSYGLVLWQRQLSEEAGLGPRLLEIRQLLAADASLVLLAPNPFDLHRASREPRRFGGAIWRGDHHYRQALRQAGFEVAEFWALPCGRSPEEFHLRSPRLPQPRSLSGHPLKRLLQRLSLGHLLQDRYLYLASSPGAGLARTLRGLEGRLEAMGDSGSLTLERFDLRRRGALVMICARKGSRGRLVLRIAPGDAVARVVSRNHDWIKRLHSRAWAGHLSALIPRPLAEFTMNGAQVFAEEALEGELAWKVVARKGLRQTVLTGACDFLWSLQQQTAVEYCLDDALLGHLLPETGHWPDCRAGELGTALTTALRQRLHGRQRLLVWGHGDFGYGNLLVAPGSGQLKGVIDWDTGTMHELAGVDLLNLLVQRARIEKGRSFSAALLEVGTSLLENGPAAIASAAACAMLQPLTIDNIREIIALCCLRSVHRSARYSRVFKQDLDQKIKALAWVLDSIKS